VLGLAAPAARLDQHGFRRRLDVGLEGLASTQGGRTVDAFRKRRLRLCEAQPQPLFQLMDAPLQTRCTRKGRLLAAPAVYGRAEDGGRNQAERGQRADIVSSNPAQ
jgi:hypothetical protein